jgi:hypothetical protein
LECINPVVQGVTFSNQVNDGDITKDEYGFYRKFLGLLLLSSTEMLPFQDKE